MKVSRDRVWCCGASGLMMMLNPSGLCLIVFKRSNRYVNIFASLCGHKTSGLDKITNKLSVNENKNVERKGQSSLLKRKLHLCGWSQRELILWCQRGWPEEVSKLLWDLQLRCSNLNGKYFLLSHNLVQSDDTERQLQWFSRREATKTN